MAKLALKDRIILTTGQCATLCQVTARTVTKWIDTKQLKAYRLPSCEPGVPGDRRVIRNALLEFMRKHDLPMTTVPKEWLKEPAVAA